MTRTCGNESSQDADVIVVGAGPTGLTLAAELRLAGVRTLVLERRPQHRDTPKANGFNGQIVELLRYRGLLDRVAAAGNRPVQRAPQLPFGGTHLDFSHLTDPPMWVLRLPQPRLERVLGEHADELGAEIRRGHEVVAVSQDDAAAVAQVRGPDGSYQVSARYLVGCDGARSRVRDLAGIAFPGTTYPEVNRLGQGIPTADVTVLADGAIEVPGLGLVRPGFTRTDRGAFALGRLATGHVMIQTTEDEPVAVDDDVPMSLAEFQGSIRRVLGAELPLAAVTRLSRYGFQARQADRYRDGRILVAGDAAHQFPATGIGINTGMMDAVNLGWKLAADVHGWAPPGLLGTYHDERHVAGARGMLQTQAQVALRRGQDPAADALRELFVELMADEQPLRHLGELIAGADLRYPPPHPSDHPLTGTFAPNLPLHTEDGDSTSVAELMRSARPVFLDLSGRTDLLQAARPWEGRVNIHSASADNPPADALLVRPDAYIAWAATVGGPVDTDVPTLREALSRWFGAPPTDRDGWPRYTRFPGTSGGPSSGRA
ncbi:MAG TPA: FAD-dependent monooxygenase [Streptosporangiaceae bacterium]|nr:FAD-dependent monooxygenase [Streptosporangiaceae bacterium]